MTPDGSDDSKAVIRRYYAEVWARQNPDACESFYSPGFVDHNPAGARRDRGAAVRSVKLMVKSMTDPKMEVLHLIGENDMVAAHWELQWTNTGRFLGLQCADGMRLSLHGHDFYRVRDGMITDVWHCEDFYGLERRLRREGRVT